MEKAASVTLPQPRKKEVTGGLNVQHERETLL
jgi:hypothetical protein